MNQYKQLTEGQRYQISALLKAGTFQKIIALIIGVSPPTISRELECNTEKRGYRPKQANIKAERRRQEAGKSIKMTFEVVNLIETKIQLDWSPEQVSGWLAKEENIRISHERIYQHVWADKRHGGELYKHLRQSVRSNTDQRISEVKLETESV